MEQVGEFWIYHALALPLIILHHSNRETGREMYHFQVGLVGTDGSVRMISEVAEEEREALEAKVVEKSTESMRPVF